MQVLNHHFNFEQLQFNCTYITEENMLDKFDRVVFNSIVEKVIVGDISEDGTIDPYKLTFVLKGMKDRIVSDAKNRYKNLKKTQTHIDRNNHSFRYVYLNRKFLGYISENFGYIF